MCVDDIMLLKPFNDCLPGPITGSINKSVNTGNFPRELNTATITLTLLTLFIAKHLPLILTTVLLDYIPSNLTLEPSIKRNRNCVLFDKC